MKILQLGKFYPIKGGVEKVMYALAEGLSGQGIHCDVLFACSDANIKSFNLNPHCKIYLSKTLVEAKATMISPEMIVMLRRICHQYDIIHVHHPDPMAALALYLSGYKGKVVLHWHSDIIRQHSLLKFYRPLQTWLINRCEVIVGTTPVYVSQSPELKEVQHKVTWLPIGIPEPYTDQEKMLEIKRKYAGKRIIFSLGRLVLYKGFEYLIQAAQELDDSYVVLLGGTGHQHQHLKKLIEAAGLQDKVVMLGYIPDQELGAYFEASTLFCLTSVDKREAFAIVQVNAMAHGKPIVSVNIPESGVPWVNQHLVTGVNVSPRDSHAIADAIRLICEDDEKRRIFGENARRRYQSVFRDEEMISGCQSIYTSILQRK